MAKVYPRNIFFNGVIHTFLSLEDLLYHLSNSYRNHYFFSSIFLIYLTLIVKVLTRSVILMKYSLRHNVLCKTRANERPRILYQCRAGKNCSLAMQSSVSSTSNIKVTFRWVSTPEILYYSWFYVNSNLLQPVSYSNRMHSVAHMLLIIDAQVGHLLLFLLCFFTTDVMAGK